MAIYGHSASSSADFATEQRHIVKTPTEPPTTVPNKNPSKKITSSDSMYHSEEV